VTLVLQELGRELKSYLSRRDKNRLQEDRARAVCSIIPEIAEKVAEIVDLPVPDTSAIEGRIMRKVVAKKMSRDGRVRLEVKNYTSQPGALTIYDISPDAGEGADPEPAIVTELDAEYTKVWQVEIDAGGAWCAEYRGAGGGTLEIRGVPPEHVVVVDLNAEG